MWRGNGIYIIREFYLHREGVVSVSRGNFIYITREVKLYHDVVCTITMSEVTV